MPGRLGFVESLGHAWETGVCREFVESLDHAWETGVCREFGPCLGDWGL